MRPASNFVVRLALVLLVAGCARHVPPPPPPPPPPAAQPPSPRPARPPKVQAPPPPATGVPKDGVPAHHGERPGHETAAPSAPARIPVLGSVPKASTSKLFEPSCLSDGSLTYQRITNRLGAILSSLGYADRRRFLTPTGFGIATAFERITDAGEVVTQSRWDTAPVYNSAWQILTLNARPGRYRSFLLIFGKSIAQEDKARAFGAMADFSSERDFTLPPEAQAMKGGPGDHLEVLVYEYKRPSIGSPAMLSRDIKASQHLNASGLGPRLDAICGRSE